MSRHMKLPDPLVFGASKVKSWKSFLLRWEAYNIISQLDTESRIYKVSILISCLGEEALEVYQGFRFTTPDSDRTVNEILSAFEKYCVGLTNVTYERFVFWKRKQEDGESFDNFFGKLCVLIKSCNFCDDCSDSLMRDRIVTGIRDHGTRQDLLKVHNLDLQKCTDICKAAESASSTSQGMQHESGEVLKLSEFRRTAMKKDCLYCGYAHVMKKELCPAYGKICNTCNGKNHFESMCPDKPKQKYSQRAAGPRKTRDRRGTPRHSVHHLESTSEDSDGSDPEDVHWVKDVEWVQAVTAGGKGRDAKCVMLLDAEEVVFQIDTGATVNMLPAKYATNIEPYQGVLAMWNKTLVKPMGVCRRLIENPKTQKIYNVEFLIFDDKHRCQPLLGLRASEQMNLVKIKQKNFHRVAAVAVDEDFKEVFDDALGELPGTTTLRLKPDAAPSVMPNRRIPVAARPLLRGELDRLVKLGVIEPVEEPTPWVSQLVLTKKKNGSLRICLDPQELNKVLMREHFTMPILEDVLHDMKDAKVFTKADLSSGYWHVKLDDASSDLTTFQTCFGRYRWLRMPFGLNSAAEIFQKRVLEQFNDMEGLVVIADDVVIFGRDQDEHDRRLHAFLERCRATGVKLNRDKLEMSLDAITFMGHRITKEGTMVDPEKVTAIRDMAVPGDIHGLRQFLGMVNYVGKFIPNLSTVLKPLHNLMKKDVTWTWSESQHTAFESVKNLITQSPTLAYYSPEKELILENDACEYGLGSAILQDGKPVAFASRSLSETEQRYAPIEKEMLAVVYGLEKFHHYTYGRRVDVITDHLPLVSIAMKPLSRAPKRLQGLLLRAQQYHYTLRHKPGKQIPLADALSRSPVGKPQEEEMLAVNNLTLQPIQDSRLAQIRQQTAADPTMMALAEIIAKGWPDHRSALPGTLTPYFNYRDELTAQDGIVLRGERVVIPHSMRAEIKEKVHAGHLGIATCLRRAKDIIFWPGMSAELRQYIEACATCATHADRQPTEQLIVTEVPEKPWQRIATDLLSWGGKEYLITVDTHSNFFEVDKLNSPTSEAVIECLKAHFARHGIPDVLVSDNGCQFTAYSFKTFSKTWLFQHETISPGNSQANGAAEAAVKIIKRLWRKCKATEEDPLIGLLNLRNSPTEGLDTSPAQRLFGRRTKSLLPMTESKLTPHYPYSASEAWKKQERRTRQQDTGKELRHLEPGENVRIQPLKPHAREWTEATVSKQLTGRSYEVETDDGRKYRRNRRFLRHTPRSTHSFPQLRCHTPTTTSPASCQQPQLENPAPRRDGPRYAGTMPTPQPKDSPAVDEPARSRSGRPIRKPVRYRDEE